MILTKNATEGMFFWTKMQEKGCILGQRMNYSTKILENFMALQYLTAWSMDLQSSLKKGKKNPFSLESEMGTQDD